MSTESNEGSLLSGVTSFINRKILRTDKSRWNYQYQKGLWNGLENMDELARFSVIGGYVQYLKPDQPAILEIGCGEGILSQRIGKPHYGYFEGTDVADAAIANAQQRYGDDKTYFHAVDMNEYRSDKKFDIIIFNEAIYYLRPMAEKLVSMYAPLLKEDGLLIISMNTGRHADSKERWAQIATAFETLDSTFVETSKNGWDIKVLKPVSKA